MAVMRFSRGGAITSTNKPISIGSEAYRSKVIAAAVERASESIMTRFVSGALAAGSYLMGVIPWDCELVAVKIKATTAGQNGTATLQVKVGVAGSEAGIHTARAVDATTVITPTLTTTTATANDVVIVTYVEDTGTEAADVIVELVLRSVADKYNDPS